MKISMISIIFVARSVQISAHFVFCLTHSSTFEVGLQAMQRSTNPTDKQSPVGVKEIKRA